MNKLAKNMLLFTVGLGLLTLSVEVFRNGRLQIEEPIAFGMAIIVLGIIGGYIITWVAEGRNR